LPSGIELAALAALVVGAAVLYSSGGHAGASAYLGLMALFGVAAPQMRPTALVLNIAVAAIGTIRFARAGAVPWRTVLPLLVGSVPAAFAGGAIRPSPGTYLTILGALLLVAAVPLWLPPRPGPLRAPPAGGILAILGAGFGFLAGLTGVGGGIFLSPTLVLSGWEEPRRASGASAVFILANSASGLLGHATSVTHVPMQAAALAACAVSGGLVGSFLGAHRLRSIAIRRVHGTLLLVSGCKLLWEGLT